MPRAETLPVAVSGPAGDALGAPVEFMSFRDLAHRFGTIGIQDYVPAYGRLAVISDDTRMTLYGRRVAAFRGR